MRKPTITVVSTMLIVLISGCKGEVGVKKDNFDAAITRIDALQKESEKYRAIADQLNTTVKDGTTTISQALVDSSKNFGTSIDPLGIKALLDENKSLRDELQRFKSKVQTDYFDRVTRPIGSILAFAGSASEVPENWKLCDGSELTRKDFPELFRVIGTHYGGTGELTFKIPDCRGYFLRGVDPGGKVDAEKRIIGSIQADCLQQHRHEGKWHQAGQDDHGSRFSNSEYPVNPDEGGHTTYHTGNVINARVGNETRPKNIAVHWIIKCI